MQSDKMIYPSIHHSISTYQMIHKSNILYMVTTHVSQAKLRILSNYVLTLPNFLTFLGDTLIPAVAELIPPALWHWWILDHLSNQASSRH